MKRIRHEEDPTEGLEDHTEKMEDYTENGVHSTRKYQTDPLHFNFSADLTRLVKPGKFKKLKGRGHVWKNVTKNADGMGGNWTKGYKFEAEGKAKDGTKAGWQAEGLMKGFWSLTQALGHWIVEQFWTYNATAQLQLTLGKPAGGKLSLVLSSGNWSNANVTYEADGLDKVLNSSNLKL